MSFILKMAWRDSRASRGRLLLAAFSIVLGVAALVAVGSVAANLRQAVDAQAKQLLGADLEVSSHQPLTPEVRRRLDALGGEIAHGVTFASMVVLPDSGGRTRLVSVHAIDGGYPFYGHLVTDPAGAAARLRGGGEVAVLEDTLMAQFGVKPGDRVKLGRSTFRVAGALKRLPSESGAGALFAPRVFVPLASIPATGLLDARSLANYETYVKLPPAADAGRIAEELRQAFPERRIRVETVADRRRRLGRTMENVDSFLSLVGFIALLLGAIGVASSVQVYVRHKLATVAVLRCLGARARTGFAIYLVQGLALGLVGALAGSALGVAVQFLVPELLRGYLPISLTVFVAWPAVARGAGAGLVVCVLFTLLPLLAVRRVPPLAVLRADAAEEAAARRDPWRIGVFIVMLGAVAALSAALASTPRIGLAFAGALVACLLVLAGLARIVMWAVRRFFPRRAPYAWRQGLANLYRPNNRTLLLLVSLGLGSGLLLTLVLTRATLLGELRVDRGGRSNLLFFDIQDDQFQPLEHLLAARGAHVQIAAPVVTMRLSSVKGVPVERLLHDKAAHVAGWALSREYRSTYRATLADSERVVAGHFEGRVAAGTPVVPVSLEAHLAKDLHVGLGDELDFDVQGVPVRTRISSLREVEWRRLQPNFFVVFPTGVLEDAPKTYIVALHAASADESARLQQAVTADFPNVSAIDLRLVLATIDGIVSKAGYVIRFMVLFTVLTGFVVLAGALVSGRAQRLKENVLLRTLGASRGLLTRIQLVEYVILGLLGAVTGAVLSVGLGWLLARYLFKTSLVVPFGALVAGAAGVVVATLVTGWLANRGIARQPPLEVLRREG